MTRRGLAALMVVLGTLAGVCAAATATSLTPPSATTGPVTSVQPTSAVVTGTVNPNGTTTTWSFQYGPSSSTTYTSATTSKSAGGGTSGRTVSGTLTGLVAATSYRYRIVATNSAGTTDGAVGIFNTYAAPVVITGAASHLTATSAILNGIVNPEGLATSWYFEYGTSTSYGRKTATETLPASPNDTNVSSAISTLTPQTTYYFRLVATSGAGTSLGADLELKTGLSVTLNASESTVVYGSFVELSGSLTSGLSGVQVTLLAEQFDQSSYTGVAAITTGPNGAWSYSARPTVRTTYEAAANGGTSSPVAISVRPVVYLNALSGGALSTRVVGAMSFASHVLQLQRLTNGLWSTWKYVRLNARAKATFTTSLPRGRTMIRMAIGPFVAGANQAGPGYLAGFSRELVYVAP